MAEVLVTGGTGLLGSRVLARLTEHHDVVAVARCPPQASRGVRWVTHDLSRPTLPPDLPHHVDAVVHLAQSREFREFPSRAGDIYAINVASTALLLAWALEAGARRFILASTGGVYGTGSGAHVEDEPIGWPGVPSFY